METAHLKMRKRMQGKKKKQTGRPAKNADTTSPMYFETDLHALLCSRLPEFAEDGRIKVSVLAEAMGYSAFRVYCILASNKLSVRAVHALLSISAEKGDRPKGEGLIKDDLVAFLLN